MFKWVKTMRLSAMANNPYKPTKKKKFTVNTKNMGVNIDKNEYYEIILSNSARPDEFKKKLNQEY